MGLARRKLHDASMRSFLVGNTRARALTSRGKRFAWLAVGDLRNVLETVRLTEEEVVDLSLNDASGLVAARNLLMVRLALRREDAAAVAVWCDAFVSPRCLAVVREELAAIRRGRAGRVARLWLDLDMDVGTARAKRSEALGVEGSGHAVAGASASWRASGASTSESLTAKTLVPNPTMFDVEAPGVPFVETTGPQGAFDALAGLESGTEAFARAVDEAWRPLFEALRNARPTLRTTVRDCAARVLRSWPHAFDAVDASNVADYVGLWNLLVACPPLAKRTGFLRTEHALTVANSLDALLNEEFPFCGDGMRRLLDAAGWRPRQVPGGGGGGAKEKVLRVEWRRTCRRRLEKREEAPSLVAQLLERSAPIPMNADMLGDAKVPIELSYAWPKVTCATVVEIALAARTAALDAVFECDAFRSSRARHLLLALKLDLSARPKRTLSRLVPKLVFRRRLFRRVKWRSLRCEGREDLFALRAGVFEPALGVALLRDDRVLRDFMKNQGWVVAAGKTTEAFNAAFDWCLTAADYRELQLLDQVRFPRFQTSTFRIPWPSGGGGGDFGNAPLETYFRYAVLLDVQTFRVLCAPVRL
ncbi:hypothetical protein CTAYLR_002328 [Chrysophaeum taylorii]|uniref:DUF4470 domain-containing protein n=1 Tax=Chrysophaeum taylorii TaxID=2483200 RepID=A0AAD7UIF3_9STRA|nr:hypothetical protein CTAYLR_002328 [Chrysophaeum taylorii]